MKKPYFVIRFLSGVEYLVVTLHGRGETHFALSRPNNGIYRVLGMRALLGTEPTTDVAGVPALLKMWLDAKRALK